MLTLCERHLKWKIVHSEKFMDVSGMQVSDKDGYRSRSNTIKANSKIVKERIWTLDSNFASKSEFQLLEPDTDAQLHKERVISVRNEAEFVSRVLRDRLSRVECGHFGNFLSA